MSVIKCIPTLQSNDAAKSFEFYQSVFDFQKDWEHRYEPGFPLFISMSHGSMTIFITEHKNGSAFGAEIYIFVEDVKSISEAIEEMKVEFDVALNDTPYGTREFNIRDPDGNKLRIGQSLN